MTSTVPIVAEDFAFAAGDERLAATRVLAAGRPETRVLHLHGLGLAASRHVVRYLLDVLAQHGHGSVTFDFAGNGDSTGGFLDESLRRRRTAALAAAGTLDPDGPRVLMGTSMGAHLAAWTVPQLRPRGLVLFCPAAYSAAATDVPFRGYRSLAADPDADGLVRPGDFPDSPAYAGISEFDGHLLIVAGRQDEVIPPAIIDGYLAHARNARSTRVIWLDCTHFVHRWLPDQPQPLAEVTGAVLKLLADTGRTDR